MKLTLRGRSVALRTVRMSVRTAVLEAAQRQWRRFPLPDHRDRRRRADERHTRQRNRMLDAVFVCQSCSKFAHESTSRRGGAAFGECSGCSGRL
jgi:hypothetical protein